MDAPGTAFPNRESPPERGSRGPALVAAGAWLVVAFAVQLAERLIP